MGYEHHVFISYKRGKVWTQWVRDMFAPRLLAFLENEISSPEIFVDDQIQTGARWAEVLHHKVCRSKIMIAVLSAGYFDSEWCKKEMALMFEREDKHGLVGTGSNYGLLIPVRIGDGHCFPKRIRDVQYLDFEEYADPDMVRGSPRYSDFNQQLRHLAKVIANTLPLIPTWCNEWQALDGSTVITSLAPPPPSVPKPPRIIT